MKCITFIFLSVQFIFISLHLFAQNKEYVIGDGFRTPQPSLEKIFGKPLISKTEEGLRIKVWLPTRDEYKKKIGSNEIEMKLDEKTREILQQGTHHVVVMVTDTKTKKIVIDVEVWFHIIYPNKKNLMPRLIKVGDNFESGVDLSQKGKYSFMVHVNMEEKQPAITFKYEVK